MSGKYLQIATIVCYNNKFKKYGMKLKQLSADR